eukprot:COSAG05_NODE_3086_length_2335_cov_258.283989_4_plen_81_part_00
MAVDSDLAGFDMARLSAAIDKARPCLTTLQAVRQLLPHETAAAATAARRNAEHGKKLTEEFASLRHAWSQEFDTLVARYD